MIKSRYITIAALSSSVLASVAFAATQTVTANISFDTPLSITKQNDINFGLVRAAQAGTYVMILPVLSRHRAAAQRWAARRKPALL